jgi:hypothetical protein
VSAAAVGVACVTAIVASMEEENANPHDGQNLVFSGDSVEQERQCIGLSFESMTYRAFYPGEQVEKLNGKSEVLVP